jgi:tRNA (cmo5U34)-methyltransferase
MTGKPFDFEAKYGSDHDTLVRTVIPGYAHLFAMARALLSPRLGAAARLLVVGAGGGMELVTLAPASLDWRLTAVDPSPNMLKLARERAEQAGYTAQIVFHHGHVHDLPAEPVYDAATCILVLHLLDDGGKSALLAEIAARLKPGAPLVLADPFGDLNQMPITALLPAWRQFQRDHGRDETAIDALWDGIKQNVRLVDESRLADMLRDAGFDEPTRFYTAFWYGGWITTRI